MHLNLVCESPFPQYLPCKVCLVFVYSNINLQIKQIDTMVASKLLKKILKVNIYCLIFGCLKTLNNEIL